MLVFRTTAEERQLYRVPSFRSGGEKTEPLPQYKNRLSETDFTVLEAEETKLHCFRSKAIFLEQQQKRHLQCFRKQSHDFRRISEKIHTRAIILERSAIFWNIRKNALTPFKKAESYL